jgi:hypothetical protein
LSEISIARGTNYMGPSMNPSLKAGDGLRVIPYEGRKVCVGDVVVFRPPGGNRDVVHRVVSVDPEGVRTRGDNNSQIDPRILQSADIIGRVVSAHRENNRITIHGGTWGRVLGPALRAKKQLNGTISRIFHPAYHALAKSGLIRTFLPLHRKTRVVAFYGPGGRELQLLLHNRVIGRRPPDRDQWHISRPFRLFIDESALPT